MGDLILGQGKGVQPRALKIGQLVPTDLEQFADALPLLGIDVLCHNFSVLSSVGKSAVDGDVDHFIAQLADGSLDYDLIAHFLAHKGLTEGGLLADASVHGVCLL